MKRRSFFATVFAPLFAKLAPPKVDQKPILKFNQDQICRLFRVPPESVKDCSVFEVGERRAVSFGTEILANYRPGAAPR